LSEQNTETSTNTNDNVTVDDLGEALQQAEECAIQQRNQVTPLTYKILEDEDLIVMLGALRATKRSRKNWNISLEKFIEMLSDAATIDKSFTQNELIDAINPISGKLLAKGINITASSLKRDIVAILSSIFGDGTTLPASNKSRLKRKTPLSLYQLTKKATSKLPKTILCSVYAEHIFPKKLEEWYFKNPFGTKVNVEGIANSIDWYSMPEYNYTTENYLFMVLDSYHQLCGLRRLVCQTGMPSRGIFRNAFVKIAEESTTNRCGLNVAMVNDLIDKQSADFALATFSERVSSALEGIGARQEASFCRLIDNWYKAEDEPGISALDRCKYRLALKNWVLEGVSFSEFPPPCAYIKNIPIVLFEGLLTNIERKIQLYTFAKSGTYNVRSVGSLDIENFFGTFQDIDPKGTGVLRPDDIPMALSVAAELMDAKLDANR
jgi:hypothetical protein